MKVHSNDGKKAVVEYDAEELDVLERVLNSAHKMDESVRAVPIEDVDILREKIKEAQTKGIVTLSGKQNNDLYGVMISAASILPNELEDIRSKIRPMMETVESLHLSFLDLNPNNPLE